MPPPWSQRCSCVVYELRHHWRDGTSAGSFDPLTFIERLAAQVPRPRASAYLSRSARSRSALPRSDRRGAAREPGGESKLHVRDQLNPSAPFERTKIHVGRATPSSFCVERLALPSLWRTAKTDRSDQRWSDRAQDPRPPRDPDRASKTRTRTRRRATRVQRLAKTLGCHTFERRCAARAGRPVQSQAPKAVLGLWARPVAS